MVDNPIVEVKAKLLALAIENEFHAIGFGGFGTTLSTLRHYLRARFDITVGFDVIVECLKELHRKRRVFLQYWCWQDRRFKPWTSDLDDTFFNDFRLLGGASQRYALEAFARRT